MRVSSRLWALFLLAWVFLSVAGGVRAQETFRIAAVRPSFSTDLIKVGSDWRKDLQKRIQVTLQVQTDTPAADVYVHAYFYDKDDHLVAKYDKPNSIWTATPKGLQEIQIPATLSASRPNDVFFALPEDLQAKKWTTVLAVFGNNNKVVASSMPAAELPKLDFPEKSKLAPPK